MLLYRFCIDAEIDSYRNTKKYKTYKKSGTNTFTYLDNEYYIHFFYFPELCSYYFKKINRNGMIIVCDIPKYLLKDMMNIVF